ncbi:phytanoyl-CoA dioxygenase family protein [Pseudarthrobacter sp. RMG13]|uniref:Phytanoyl-CoA dioxygenase family protein n=1 Tax=Pseudarthrobacter humi TaxID=2952523 RepID=A0ABT1LPD2_9MICC|nr:phytanoyl-CoA dioxygenase family protein [Pseudarthrobacter humi]MCP9000317.1 phytanoyl-CoA dioxygenase family protein [Pseudarthrobacter humi]
MKAAQFLRTKISHALATNPNRSRTTLGDAYDDLIRTGVAVLPSYIPGDVTAKMLAATHGLDYEPTPEMQHNNPNDPLTDRFLGDAHEREEFREFFDDAALRSLIQAYISPNAVMHRAFARTKENTGPVASFENFYHFDAYKKRVKVFLYLSDVEEENAPLGILLGSHKGPWRYRRELEMFANYRKDDRGYAAGPDVAYIGCFWPHEVARLQAKYEFVPKTCTGKAGTVIVFDSQTLHVANQLMSGKRSVLVSHWIQPGHHM